MISDLIVTEPISKGVPRPFGNRDAVLIGADKIAKLMRRVFREQKREAKAGKERFGKWNGPLAKELEKEIAAMFLAGAKKAKGNPADAAEFVAAAKQRAMESARSINATTAEWLENGRDPFTAERAASIGITEAVFAGRQAFSLVVQVRKGRLKWVAKGPRPCKRCLKLNGKIVKAGKPFIVVDGVPVYHPGLHPHCFCDVEEVE